MKYPEQEIHRNRGTCDSRECSEVWAEQPLMGVTFTELMMAENPVGILKTAELTINKKQEQKMVTALYRT